MASVTQANMRLSIVNGTAFVDFSAADTLTPYLGARLTISDSAGKKLVGYIKAAGEGETYGSELLPNTAFDNTTSVVEFWHVTVASVAGGQSGNCLQVTSAGGDGQAQEVPSSLVSGRLYKLTGYLKNGGDWPVMKLALNGSPYTNWVMLGNESLPSWTLRTGYGVATTTEASASVFFVGYTDGQTSLYDEVSLKQVTAPSSTGVTIVSTPDGTTYSWASEESGFNRNDSSGYTYDIGYVPADDMGVYDYVLQEG